MRLSFRSKITLITAVPLLCAILLGSVIFLYLHKEVRDLRRFQDTASLVELYSRLSEAAYSEMASWAMALGTKDQVREGRLGGNTGIETVADAQAIIDTAEKTQAEAAEKLNSILPKIEATVARIDLAAINPELRELILKNQEEIQQIPKYREEMRNFAPKTAWADKPGGGIFQRERPAMGVFYTIWERLDKITPLLAKETDDLDAYRYLELQRISNAFRPSYLDTQSVIHWSLNSPSTSPEAPVILRRGLEIWNAYETSFKHLADDKALLLFAAMTNDPTYREVKRLNELLANTAHTGPFPQGIYPQFRLHASRMLDVILPGISRDLAILVRERNDAELSLAVRNRNLVAAFVGACLLISLASSFLATRSILRRLETTIDGVRKGATDVANASTQITEMSQNLSETSSAQAASVEETSAALAELSAITKQNVDNARDTLVMIEKAGHAVDDSVATVNRLGASMTVLSQRSKQTQDIVKNIDEIAFQTNILALNAAVEAARAGAAGAGFAVVADEVRTLAQRAAQASVETGRLIEESAMAINESAELTSHVTAAFDEMRKTQLEMRQRTETITEASKQQSVGLEEISKSSNVLQSGTMSNAAHAEESAATAAILREHACTLRTHIEDLSQYVTNSKG
ncbi:MAG: methyl-accepting chemotaxis protein [Opitutaceae bacterium]|nr:methyl-accepting chemotaxis protein [Opitutaceae bacterium]